MLVLVLGHRLGIVRALENLGIDFLVWGYREVKSKSRAKITIVKDFPEEREEFLLAHKLMSSVTHVIAGGELAVIPASKIRSWLDLSRNPHSVILRCTDKLQMKNYLLEKNIPMTPHRSAKDLDIESLISDYGFPIMAKLKISSGGKGIVRIKTAQELKNFNTKGYYFEKAIYGTEGSIESFILDKKIIFTSITEYYKNGLCNKVPCTYDLETQENIKDLNKLIIESLNIKWGMTHIEYYLTKDGVLFGEVALRPPGGYIVDDISMAYNQDMWDVFVKVELQMKDIKINNLSQYTSSIIIYPNEGVVRDFSDKKKLDIESLKKISLKLKKGSLIGLRDGVGQDYGYALLANKDQNKLNADVDKFYNDFKVEYED